MPPGLSKGLRRGLFDISTLQPQVTSFSNERTIPISGGTSIDDFAEGPGPYHLLTSELLVLPTGDLNAEGINSAALGFSASRGTKHAPSTASVPQQQTNPPSNEPMVPNSIDTSSNGASRGTKRGSSTVLAPQPQSSHTSHEPTILTSIGTSINAPKSFKKVHGKTRLALERALHAAGRKHPVTIKAEDGRPSGANSRFFVIEIGFIIRTFAPLQYECFRKIPDQEKESLVFRLLTKYDVDTSKPYVMAFIYTTMSKRYTEFRNRLKKYSEEAHKHRPDDVKKQEEWDYICDLFITNEKYKNRYAENAINRSKFLFNHCGGSKSFVNYQYEVSSEDDDEHEY